jgi:Pentapeptide repeats (8 copies)
VEVGRFLLNFLSWNGWSKVASLATAAAAITALWFSGQSLRATQAQYGLSEQGQVTDRFAKAVENLGSEKTDVRLGGIYSLERLSRDSTADRPTIMDVLSAYIRGHAPAPLPWPFEPGAPVVGGPGTPGAVHCQVDENAPIPIDIQAVATVITRRDAAIPDVRPIDLSNSCLNRVNLAGAQLIRADLSGTDLTHSDFIHTGELWTERDARYTNLSYAQLEFANMSKVFAVGASFRGATMYRTDLSNADLPLADLRGAQLWQADLRNAHLMDAKLAGADLSDANLTGTTLINVSYDSSTKWPAGFTPPPSS